MEYRLDNIEDGYAAVVRTNGRSIGHVVREKFGSTRTGAHWLARIGNTTIGYGDTRAKAVALVVEKTIEKDAASAAFLQRIGGDPK